MIKLGTRGSLLARTQSGHVADLIRTQLGREVEMVTVSTHGDRSSAPLATLGGTGVFVSALREALLDGSIDVAVHSMKDLPTQSADGIALAAVPTREDSRDALVARDGLTLSELPAGSSIGTGSPRRAAQLHALGMSFDVREIRGNVDTRMNKVAEGELDAVILARAGLARIGRTEAITETLDPLLMLPAPGQGALAIETRSDDHLLRADLAQLDDPATHAAVAAERALLAALEAGCSAPVGAVAEIVEGDEGEELWLRAIALSLDGTSSVRRSITGSPDHSVEVGQNLAALMLEDGAADLIHVSSKASE